MTEQASEHVMPKDIAEGILFVMNKVGNLVKDDENKFAKYDFVGIDAFLRAVNPACVEAGIIIAQDEESFDIRESGTGKDGNPIGWLVITYRFTIAHKSGDVWDHRPRRSIMVMANMGAQAFGAAQSYALKQFMRSLFQIATGDKEDADSHEQTNLPRYETKADLWGGPLGKTAFCNAMKVFVSELKSCGDSDQLLAFLNAEESIALLDQCIQDKPSWYYGTDSDVAGLEEQISTRKATLAEAEAEGAVRLEDGP